MISQEMQSFNQQQLTFSEIKATKKQKKKRSEILQQMKAKLVFTQIRFFGKKKKNQT